MDSQKWLAYAKAGRSRSPSAITWTAQAPSLDAKLAAKFDYAMHDARRARVLKGYATGVPVRLSFPTVDTEYFQAGRTRLIGGRGVLRGRMTTPYQKA